MEPARYLIIAIASGLVVTLLRHSMDQAVPTDGKWVLRYALPLKGLMTAGGVLFFAIGVGGVTGVLGGANESRTEQLLFSAPLLAFGIYLPLEFHLVSITVDSHGLTHRSPWRRRRVVPWTEVTGCHRSFLNEWIVIETRRGPIRMSEFLVGALELEQRVKSMPRAG
jgi:hypothetical protein